MKASMRQQQEFERKGRFGRFSSGILRMIGYAARCAQRSLGFPKSYALANSRARLLSDDFAYFFAVDSGVVA